MLHAVVFNYSAVMLNHSAHLTLKHVCYTVYVHIPQLETLAFLYVLQALRPVAFNGYCQANRPMVHLHCVSKMYHLRLAVSRMNRF